MSNVRPYIERYKSWLLGNDGRAVENEKAYKAHLLATLEGISCRLTDVTELMEKQHEVMVEMLYTNLELIIKYLDNQTTFAETSNDLAKSNIAATCIKRDADYMQVISEIRLMRTAIAPYLKDMD